MTQTISELIKQRRSQMLVHSYLYYKLDSPVIPDDTWQKWANELVSLQIKYPQKIGWYDRVFNDWDGSTGMHLPEDEWIRGRAKRLLKILDKQ